MKRLNCHNMKESLLDNPKDIEEIYEAFALMKQLGYIDEDEWEEFEDKCMYWEYNDHIMAIQDTKRDGKIIKLC